MTDSLSYLIFVDEGAGPHATESALTHDVATEEIAYLTEVVAPRLRPLTKYDYENGPHAILNTLARFSHIDSQRYLYWCIEWAPGLLVVRFGIDARMTWCALRSPNPQFGGRTASQAEIDAFDDDQPNPQYNIVFDAWDPQIRTGSA